VNHINSEKVILWLASIYLGILPISGTIALRNILLLILCLYIATIVLTKVFKKEYYSFYKHFLTSIPLIWITWCLFLILFPLWAHEQDIAIIQLRGEWLQSILSWIVGFGLAIIIIKQRLGLLSLAWISAIPNLIHLTLTLFIWLEVLDPNKLGDYPIRNILNSFDWNLVNFDLQFNKFPLNFRGLEPMHGNLGYPACQAIALFLASSISITNGFSSSKAFSYLIGLIFCFLSIIIAGSRGALFFAILIVIMFLVVLLTQNLNRKFQKTPHNIKNFTNSIFLTKVFYYLSFILIFSFAAYSIHKDPRWHFMFDRIKIGYLVENPKSFICNGLNSSQEIILKNAFPDKKSDYFDELIAGLGSDGGRIVLLRVGIDLALQHPLGLDGSRVSYQKLISLECTHSPVHHFSHAHNGWIDLSLALGWAGVIILLGVFIFFIKFGTKFISNESCRSWAYALVLICLFWTTRGLVDSVYREHLLQMQGFIIAYIFAQMRLAEKISNLN